MKREDVLEKSRNENKNKDMVEIEATNRASRISFLVGAVLCMTISILDWNITKTVNWACWTVDFGMLSVLNIITYLKAKHKKTLALAIMCVLLFLLFGYGYIFELVSVVR